MSISWDLTDPDEELESKFKPTLAARAKKRHGTKIGDDLWLVEGNPKLGDSYDEYEVAYGDDGKYHCECQGHQGGEYRNMCSHILYVIFAKREIVEYDTNGVVEKVEGLTEVPKELPIFVDQGQDPTPEMREAIDLMFGINPPLPDWVRSIRLTQWNALEEVLDHYDNGAKVVFVDAPTGAGKSLLGELVRRRVSPSRGVYTCSTKTLQHQIESDFPYASVIKGRSNYPTVDRPNAFPYFSADVCDAGKATFPSCKQDARAYPFLDEGDEFTHCSWCHPVSECPYRLARRDAGLPGLAVANVAYLTTVMNTSGFLSHEPFIIVDEADTLEDELMRYIQVSFSPKLMKLLGIGPPRLKTKSHTWGEWLTNVAIPALERERDKYPSYNRANPGERRKISHYEKLAEQCEMIEPMIDDDWVYTGYDYGAAIFKPVRIGELGQTYLWQHNDRWLLMSATIISAEQMADDLGLEDHEWASVQVPSSFDPERRPIYVETVASMTYKTQEQAWPVMAKRVREITRQYPDEPILVHTVSYALAKKLTEAVGVRAITYTDSQGRDGALAKFKVSHNGVLIAPSFDRGIDLPYDECQVVIVTKIPYPNYGDKQVNKRLHSKGGQGWYIMQTCRSLVQMTGRAMRFEDDACEMYVLDSQFYQRIWKESKRMLPQWWVDALLFGKEAQLHRDRIATG